MSTVMLALIVYSVLTSLALVISSVMLGKRRPREKGIPLHLPGSRDVVKKLDRIEREAEAEVLRSTKLMNEAIAARNDYRMRYLRAENRADSLSRRLHELTPPIRRL